MSGDNEQNAIRIPDDEEVRDDLQKKVEQKISDDRINEALMSGDQFLIQSAVVLSLMQEKEDDKMDVLKRKFWKYFKDKADLDIKNEYFKQRLQADYSKEDTHPNPKQLILYGVDFLSTKEIRKMFLSSDPENIEWLTDSTCKLIFKQPEQAKDALKAHILDESQLNFKIELDGESVPRGWFQLNPYTIYSFQRRLFARYTTNLEVNFQKQVKTTKYIKYKKVKGQFLNSILDSSEAQAKYQEVKEQDRMKSRRNGRNGTFNRSSSRMEGSRSRSNRRSESQYSFGQKNERRFDRYSPMNENINNQNRRHFRRGSQGDDNWRNNRDAENRNDNIYRDNYSPRDNQYCFNRNSEKRKNNETRQNFDSYRTSGNQQYPRNAKTVHRNQLQKSVRGEDDQVDLSYVAEQSRNQTDNLSFQLQDMHDIDIPDRSFRKSAKNDKANQSINLSFNELVDKITQDKKEGEGEDDFEMKPHQKGKEDDHSWNNTNEKEHKQENADKSFILGKQAERQEIEQEDNGDFTYKQAQAMLLKQTKKGRFDISAFRINPRNNKIDKSAVIDLLDED